MSWPRKNDGMRLYKQNDGNGFMLLIPDEEFAVANVLAEPEPSLCGCAYPTSLYLLNRCKRVSWNDLPNDWKQAFQHYLAPKFEGDEDLLADPTKIRGLWRIGEDQNDVGTVTLFPHERET